MPDQQVDIHVGAIGTRLEVTFRDQDDAVINIGPATTKELTLRRPDGTTLTKPLTPTTDGADGKAYYETVDGDLTVAGLWKMQGRVVLPGGSWPTGIETFRVQGNLF